jgi:formate hydrogenlyase transcriptional activator
MLSPIPTKSPAPFNKRHLLFAFSNAMAAELDSNLLAGVLEIQLKGLFDIHEYAILGLNTGKDHYLPLLYGIDANATHPADIHDLLQKEAVLDHAIEHILTSESPVFLPALCFRSSTPVRCARQLLGVPLRIGRGNIAVMIFSHGNYDQMRQELCLFRCILSQIAIVVCNLIAQVRLKHQITEISICKKEGQDPPNLASTPLFPEMVGGCPPMQQVFRLIRQVAPTDCTVLILGKTGTGKELVARAIHNHSPRKDKSMIKVNCAALPPHLIESELFGHERGSFTGATERRLGKFEMANGGTLFLDEIGEMPLDLQVKLLRALQEKEIDRIGGKDTIQVDVRIIAATNRELEKAMAEGKFRSDLYYRLNIFPIVMPELRDRKEDIPLLASHFIASLAGKTGREIKGISKKALQDMLLYDWPGNIREMEHLIERSMLLSHGDMLTQVQLPSGQNFTSGPLEQRGFVVRKIEENEKEYIVNMLQHCKGRVGGPHGAAKLMGIPPSTLFSKMKKLGI